MVSTVLESNYLCLSSFPHAGFRNEVGVRKIAYEKKRGDAKLINTTGTWQMGNCSAMLITMAKDESTLGSGICENAGF